MFPNHVLRATQRRRKLAITAAAAAVLTAVALTGCSTQAPAKKDSGTITLWTWQTEADSLKPTVAPFEKAHPGVKVNIVVVGNPAIFDKITTGMAAGGAGLPDIMQVGLDYLQAYKVKFPNALADLSAMGADKYKSDFPSTIWSGSANSKGGVLGVPKAVNTLMFYYRTDLFKTANVDPASIKTWDDMIAAGVKVKAATGVPLLGLDFSGASGDATLARGLDLQQGTYYFNSKGEITMNDAGNVKTLTLLKKMKDLGILTNMQGDFGTLLNAIKTGQVSGLSLPSWMAGVMESQIPEMSGKWAVRTPPALTSGGATTAISDATYLSISNTSKNKQTAYDYLVYAATTLEAQKAIFKQSGFTPAYSPMLKQPEFQTPSEYFSGVSVNKVFADEMNQNPTTPNYTGDYNQALKDFVDAQTQVLVSGVDPKVALDAAAKQLAQATGRKIASK